MFNKRRSLAWLATGLIGGISCLNANAAESPYARLESLDKRFDALIAPGTSIEKIADDLKWSEGPLWDAKTKSLLFSDIPNNIVMRWNADKGVSRFLERSGYTGAEPFTGREPGSNGLTFDPQGRLTLCQHGDRRISRREADGTMVPVAVGFNGKKLNSPNDLVYDNRGALYFTDPPFGLPGTFTDPKKELPFNAVFRVGKGGTITAVATELEAPNGLGFSPDFKTLYVANATAKEPIWKAYAVKSDGSLDKGRLFAEARSYVKEGDGVPDGLKVDIHGNVFATGPGGVHVFAPDGSRLGRIITDVPTANVAFGEDGSTLFITANHRVLRMRTLTKGMPLPVSP
ncbi:MAG TPA: SMP-30/gluconolactonase/LRE family protein [Steroidobacteraceae bacterium]|jgi:gluconolactonase|nr:SMP-30/gluconolactonase/LRE family protein [Steroidobacteraceae bacterium]